MPKVARGRCAMVKEYHQKKFSLHILSPHNIFSFFNRTTFIFALTSWRKKAKKLMRMCEHRWKREPIFRSLSPREKKSTRKKNMFLGTPEMHALIHVMLCWCVCGFRYMCILLSSVSLCQNRYLASDECSASACSSPRVGSTHNMHASEKGEIHTYFFPFSLCYAIKMAGKKYFTWRTSLCILCLSLLKIGEQKYVVCTRHMASSTFYSFFFSALSCFPIALRTRHIFLRYFPHLQLPIMFLYEWCCVETRNKYGTCFMSVIMLPNKCQIDFAPFTVAVRLVFGCSF